MQSGRRDSNSRPSPWQGEVLPLNYARIFVPSSILQFIQFSKIAALAAQLTSWPKAIFADDPRGGPGRIRTDDLLLAKETPSR